MSMVSFDGKRAVPSSLKASRTDSPLSVRRAGWREIGWLCLSIVGGASASQVYALQLPADEAFSYAQLKGFASYMATQPYEAPQRTFRTFGRTRLGSVSGHPDAEGSCAVVR